MVGSQVAGLQQTASRRPSLRDNGPGAAVTLALSVRRSYATSVNATGAARAAWMQLSMFSRSSHLKIMLVSLLLSTAVFGICIYAKPQGPSLSIVKASKVTQTASK
jgi:hypothetical protein